MREREREWVRVCSCDLLHAMRTDTELPLSQCYDSVHRFDLERELDDRDPAGKDVGATEDKTDKIRRDPPGNLVRASFDGASHTQNVA